MNIMNDFIEGKTPSVAYTDDRQTGKTSLIAAGIIVEAIGLPDQMIGINTHNLMSLHNVILRIVGLVSPDIIKSYDNYSITFINDTKVMQSSYTEQFDINFNDEAAYTDGVHRGRRKTFCATSWTGEGTAYRAFAMEDDTVHFSSSQEDSLPLSYNLDDITEENDLVLRFDDMSELTWGEFENEYTLDHSVLNTPTITAEPYLVTSDNTINYINGTTTMDMTNNPNVVTHAHVVLGDI
jgi:hypothetical protein